MARKIIIVTSSYGSDYIQEIGGQKEILATVKAAGADGVEIRRELFSAEELSQLSELAQAIKHQQLECFYSVPFSLFLQQFPEQKIEINPNIEQYFDEAKQLDAKLIKFSLGDFQLDMSSVLAERLAAVNRVYPDILCVIENDQALKSGNLHSMAAFAEWLKQHKLPLCLAFDSGNWVWVQQDPQTAAQKLAPYVGYVHLKSTALDAAGKLSAVPPTGSADNYVQILQRNFSQDIPLGIEFPLIGENLVATSLYFVELLKG
ncbi:sugar phosphate isomerase/epimerase family protein [Testudinibacter aquarius]|uniref:Sugar phosphate isomerase/epimerase n=1 Tax=Testudinibacter aquarius TaxID=1524974 RepID=A0A4R3YEK1_9PAST|nr:TIM barrel protein [Testudinibacter aquarius]KAE9529010.1 hypothetical protein A1D24_09080 [Testudinibacter aquarius]TCV89294.1 sugar phosphate isomerase/epimerase [Testudinibacter aquarius]TNG93347.1 TIM barrel protein [Testudinibacter aquarius]